MCLQQRQITKHDRVQSDATILCVHRVGYPVRQWLWPGLDLPDGLPRKTSLRCSRPRSRQHQHRLDNGGDCFADWQRRSLHWTQLLASSSGQWCFVEGAAHRTGIRWHCARGNSVWESRSPCLTRSGSGRGHRRRRMLLLLIISLHKFVASEF